MFTSLAVWLLNPAALPSQLHISVLYFTMSQYWLFVHFRDKSIQRHTRVLFWSGIAFHSVETFVYDVLDKSVPPFQWRASHPWRNRFPNTDLHPIRQLWDERECTAIVNIAEHQRPTSLWGNIELWSLAGCTTTTTMSLFVCWHQRFAPCEH